MHRLVFFVVFAMLATCASVYASCPFTELTMTPSGLSLQPVANADGTRIAFTSSADPLGINPDGSFEVLILDIPSNTLIPLTNTDVSSASQSMDDTGTIVVYQSSADITGANRDGSFEIFMGNTATITTTQITQTPQDSTLPQISGDGQRLVFRSEADFAGTNPDGSREIFLLLLESQLMMQLSNDPSLNSTIPTISRDGSTVAFLSDGSLTGENPNNDRVLFVYPISTGILRQVSPDVPDGHLTLLSLSSDGTALTFHSGADVIGENPDGFTQIFLIDLTTDILTQVTHFAADATFPTLSPSGDTIVFTSEVNLGGNPEENFELFEYTRSTGWIRQLTSTASGIAQPLTFSGDGQTVFSAWNASVPGNPELNFELFSVAPCGLLGDGFESGDTAAWSNAVGLQ